jgi:hypothetical protein
LDFESILPPHQVPSTGHQRVKPVLDHMLSSLAAKSQRNPGPFVALFFHPFQKLNVFVDSPGLTAYLLIHVVIPAFTALLWSLEIPALGRVEDMPGYLSPLELPNSK